MNVDLRFLNQPFSNTIQVDGKDFLYFGGTAYLGIPQNRDFINLYIEGIKKYGLNNGTSRSNNIQLGIYNEAENVAAKRFHADAALITSSGYLAAQMTINELSSFGKVIYAPATHPALWQSTPPDCKAQSFSAWKKETINFINSSVEKNWVIISNSMNNLVPEIYDFDFVSEIDSHKKIILVVDDSHGIGVNNDGLGTYCNLTKQNNLETVVVASMAKALGVDAGLVLGSHHIITQLKNTNLFNGASPSAAAGAYAFIHAEEIYLQALNKLKHNMNRLSNSANLTWKFEFDFPVYLFGDEKLPDRLYEKQILISSFHYPTKNDELLNRIVLSSWHSDEDIDYLIAHLQ